MTTTEHRVKMLAALAALWDACPEQRLGQLLVNLMRDDEGYSPASGLIFYANDDVLHARMEHAAKEGLALIPEPVRGLVPPGEALTREHTACGWLLRAALQYGRRPTDDNAQWLLDRARDYQEEYRRVTEPLALGRWV